MINSYLEKIFNELASDSTTTVDDINEVADYAIKCYNDDENFREEINHINQLRYNAIEIKRI